MQDKERDAFTKNEVAKRLNVSYGTVHKLTQAGAIRTVRAGRRVLIPKVALEQFLAA